MQTMRDVVELIWPILAHAILCWVLLVAAGLREHAALAVSHVVVSLHRWFFGPTSCRLIGSQHARLDGSTRAVIRGSDDRRSDSRRRRSWPGRPPLGLSGANLPCGDIYLQLVYRQPAQVNGALGTFLLSFNTLESVMDAGCHPISGVRFRARSFLPS